MQQYIALFAVLSSLFVTTLNEGMTKVASPFLAETFTLGYSQLTWVYNCYQIIYTVLMPVFGLMSDTHGRRRVLIGGLTAFGIGSLLCSVAWNYPSLLIFRVVHGIGAAAVFPVSVVIASTLFPPEHRGRVMGLWGMILSLGTAAGPTIGGAVIRLAGWRSIFLLSAPCSFLSLLVVALTVKADSTSPGYSGFDTKGTVLLCVIIVTLVVVCQNGPTMGWTSPSTSMMLLVLAVSTTAFFHVERSTSEPVIDLKVFGNRTFLSGFYCGGTHYLSMQGIQFLMPLFLSRVMGMDIVTIGLLLAPQAAIGLVISPLAGWLEDRYTAIVPVGAGSIIRVTGLLSFAFLTQRSSMAFLIAALLLDGIGAALIRVPSMNSAVRAFPSEKAASVTGIYNMARFFLATVGVVLLGLALDGLYTDDFISNAPVPGFFHSYLVLAGMTACGLLLVRFLNPKGSTVRNDAAA